MNRALSAAVGLAALFASDLAQASPSFPEALKSDLGLSCAVTCSLCHSGGQTGAGTVNTPFGASMRAHGLASGDTASLQAALDAMGMDLTDSDGDGTPDVEELVACGNPNGTSGGASSAAPPPAYGCGASVAPPGPSSSGAWLAALGGLGAVWVARRSRARRRQTAALFVLALGGAGLAGCYDVSYVSPDVCSTGLQWTGGDMGGSPLMNPGQDCIGCHQRQGEGPALTFAGTVYSRRQEADDCVGSPDARVYVTGSDGRTIELVPNEVGNFYTTLDVALPYTAVLLVNGQQEVMVTPQSSGDCNSCHTATGANGAPGRVSMP
jgi:MYXO-CTERM domain-containing protein